MNAACRIAPVLLALSLVLFAGNLACSADEKASQGSTGQGENGPLANPDWWDSLLHDEAAAAAAKKQLHQAEKWLREQHQPIIPASTPIAITLTEGEKKVPRLVYRDYWGIVSRYANTGKLIWESPSDWSLEHLLSRGTDHRRSEAILQWLQHYSAPQYRHPQILFGNSMTGTLSTDGRFVYTVEDLPVPAYPAKIAVEKRIDKAKWLNDLRRGRMVIGDPWSKRSDSAFLPYGLEVENAISHNRLEAFDLTNGKLMLQLGVAEKGPLADCFFLGPPLPLDDKLYFLIEKKKEVSLVRLGRDQANPKNPFWKIDIESIQPLARAAPPLSEQPYRRLHAIHLVHSDGILICPANDGTIFGVDVRKGDVKWTYAYRKKEQAPPPPSSAWHNTAPLIAEGKIVFAPPDSPSIHCLNLRDGAVVWSAKKSDDDLYLTGVFGDKVLLVGKQHVRALSLAKGEALWTLNTGLPSGRGVVEKGTYYLPLREAGSSKKPEICVIDVKNGRIRAHRTWHGKEPPGNLLLVADNLISQSPWEIAAYPK